MWIGNYLCDFFAICCSNEKQFFTLNIKFYINIVVRRELIFFFIREIHAEFHYHLYADSHLSICYVGFIAPKLT